MHKRYPSNQLCIAGGCGANSVANGKVTSNTPFKQLYVQAASGDAGGALGAALDVWHKLGHERCRPMGDEFGPSPTSTEIMALLDNPAIKLHLSSGSFSIFRLGDLQVPDESALLDQVCIAIADGLVVGWFEGRMEWGPRALAHRSILGDPRRSDMKDILNLKIKRRESFVLCSLSIARIYS